MTTLPPCSALSGEGRGAWERAVEWDAVSKFWSYTATYRPPKGAWCPRVGLCPPEGLTHRAGRTPSSGASVLVLWLRSC